MDSSPRSASSWDHPPASMGPSGTGTRSKNSFHVLSSRVGRVSSAFVSESTGRGVLLV